MAHPFLKNAGIRLAALLAAFAVGITTYRVAPKAVADTDIPSAAAKREDDLHRLYEAAMLSGDSGLREGIILRLMCIDGPTLECHQARNNFEPALSWLLKSHGHWVQQNMVFIREISTAEKARAYTIEHLR
jgi:hypothetical protein